MRVLFDSTPLYSHITPTLPLAEALQAAGHEVVFATGPESVAQVEDAGLTAFTAGHTYVEALARYNSAFPPESLAGLTAGQRWEHIVEHGSIALVSAAIAVDLVPFAQQWRPDLVIGNLTAVGGVVAAALTGATHVMHAFGPPKTAEIAESRRRGHVRLYERWGVDPRRARTDFDGPYLDIWPSALAADSEGQNLLYQDAWPMRPESALPLPVRPPRPALLEGLPYDRTAYVTLGTTYNRAPGVFAALFEALRDERVNVVATIGSDADPEAFGAVPQHVRVARFVPQLDILPHCDVVVCQAGAGTVLGTLAHGLPLVMLPVASDHHDIARHIEAGGAGLVCPPGEGRADALREALHRVGAEPAFRAAAEEVRRQMLEMPDTAQIVTRLEKLAAR
jgi:UDP:flavonoid glycosyltransferase YjiC (YdhE family)